MTKLNETYQIRSENFDGNISLSCEIKVNLSETEMHEMNDFWSNADWRLQEAKQDIKQVFCSLYAQALIYGYIHDNVYDVKTANKYLESREGYWHNPEVVVEKFNCEFDRETDTTYSIKRE